LFASHISRRGISGMRHWLPIRSPMNALIWCALKARQYQSREANDRTNRCHSSTRR
jgi:hypothetical protein